MVDRLAEPIKCESPVGSVSVPLTILTGFLGAGKTTLLNRILKGDHGLRVAVLVNDFGTINIDADLVVGVESGGAVISLANGCVCCTIRDDLVEAVARVLERPERPEYVVLEASGVADPVGIATTFMDPHFHDRIRLDSITTVMDAEQIFAAPELQRLKLWQIGCADLLILNKVDLVSREQIARIKDWLEEHFHRYRLIEAIRCNVPLEILLAVGRFDATQVAPLAEHARGCNDPNCDNHDRHLDHGRTFGTWSFETDQPLSLDALREAVRGLPNDIYRCKGVIYSADVPGSHALLQVVGKRVNLVVEDGWKGTRPRTRIVVIGAAGKVDEGSLRKSFASCVSNQASD